MNRPAIPTALPILMSLLWAGCADRSRPLGPDATYMAAAGPHAIQVSTPTGNPTTDRASIVTALSAVQKGGTIQFAAGTYEIGLLEPFAAIPVPVARITLLGHPDGTTLRGCDPAEILPGLCEGLWLIGGGQKVRNLEFVDMSSAIILEAAEDGTGGYRIEHNRIRNSYDGITLFGQLVQPGVVRHNTFTNVGAAVFLLGSALSVTDNEFSVPEPGLVPGGPFAALFALAWDAFGIGPCDGNVVAGNSISGYPVAVGLEVVGGVSCSHNLVRDNTIVDSGLLPGLTLAPLFVWNYSDDEALTRHNVFQRNRVLGASGTAVAIVGSSHTRVVGNTFRDIASSPDQQWLGPANGSGVWVSPGSGDNRILSNSFRDLGSYAVVLEGNHNHVATTSASDEILDLGTGNKVTGPGSPATLAAVGAQSAATASIDFAERTSLTGARPGLDVWLSGSGANRGVPARAHRFPLPQR